MRLLKLLWKPFPGFGGIHSLQLTVRTCQEGIPKGNTSCNHAFAGAMFRGLRFEQYCPPKSSNRLLEEILAHSKTQVQKRCKLWEKSYTRCLPTIFGQLKGGKFDHKQTDTPVP